MGIAADMVRFDRSPEFKNFVMNLDAGKKMKVFFEVEEYFSSSKVYSIETRPFVVPEGTITSNYILVPFDTESYYLERRYDGYDEPMAHLEAEKMQNIEHIKVCLCDVLRWLAPNARPGGRIAFDMHIVKQYASKFRLEAEVQS